MIKISQTWGPAPRRQIDAPKTLADEAYQRIHDDIIRGAFAPNEKLQPDALRQRYDIGLSPLREALSRLALEGLAVAEGQRGFFVAPATRAELLDIADLRIQFSVMSLDRSIQRGDDAWENAVVTTYYQLNKLENQGKREPRTFHDEWERRNRAFHEALESACGSPWLTHFCDILYDHFERYRRRFLVYTEIDPTIADEHRQIMELALARDPAACKVLKLHYEHAARVIRALMEKADDKLLVPAKKAKSVAAAKPKPAAKPPARSRAAGSKAAAARR
jgi:GntR family transcriptional regulator, carbon starvation induced regulator